MDMQGLIKVHGPYGYFLNYQGLLGHFDILGCFHNTRTSKFTWTYQGTWT